LTNIDGRIPLGAVEASNVQQSEVKYPSYRHVVCVPPQNLRELGAMWGRTRTYPRQQAAARLSVLWSIQYATAFTHNRISLGGIKVCGTVWTSEQHFARAVWHRFCHAPLLGPSVRMDILSRVIRICTCSDILSRVIRVRTCSALFLANIDGCSAVSLRRGEVNIYSSLIVCTCSAH
jgi:hypothetical protein